ncbi:MAG: hypothetical protein Q9208_004140 [Pyrenodesmia sp. 3 TL-2023]
MTDTKPSTLMSLPTEIRLQILGHLLSVDATIHTCGSDYSSRLELNMHFRFRLKGIRWYDHGCHRHPCLRRRELPSPAVLGLNRRLYEEGTSILYARNFDINVTAAGLQFLQWGGQIGHIPEFPFHRAKELTIKIMPTLFHTNGLKLYIVLATLCSHIASISPSLRKVRIIFHDEHERYTKEGDLLVQDWKDQPEFVNRRILAGSYEREPYTSIMETILDTAEGFSAFEWYLQPLHQLPMAEECSIEIPRSVRSNERAILLSQQCALSVTQRIRIARPGEQETRQIGYAMRQYPFGFEKVSPGVGFYLAIYLMVMVIVMTVLVFKDVGEAEQAPRLLVWLFGL